MSQSISIDKIVNKLTHGSQSIILIDKIISYSDLHTMMTILSTNSTLLKLDLRLSKIDTEGAKLVGAMLATNSTLTDINLCSTSMGAGTAYIIDALTINSTLRKLNLCQNVMSIEIINMIEIMLRSNVTLQELLLVNNAINCDEV